MQAALVLGTDLHLGKAEDLAISREEWEESSRTWGQVREADL